MAHDPFPVRKTVSRGVNAENLLAEIEMAQAELSREVSKFIRKWKSIKLTRGDYHAFIPFLPRHCGAQPNLATFELCSGPLTSPQEAGHSSPLQSRANRLDGIAEPVGEHPRAELRPGSLYIEDLSAGRGEMGDDSRQRKILEFRMVSGL